MPPSPRLGSVSAYFGAQHDLDTLVRTHLFLLAPNNSGSSFLQKALATTERSWNLAREGQHVLGFQGPRPSQANLDFIWASDPEWVARFRDPHVHDWERTRKAWYFQATSRSPAASIFTTKAPPFLLIPHLLASGFPNTHFLIMVRNPYAMAAGIIRCRSQMGGVTGEELRRRAAAHLLACFEAQLQARAAFAPVSTFFRYEDMCDNPPEVETQIRALVPELDDLRLRQQMPIKRLYSGELRNLNDDQIARLTSTDIELLNEVFGPHEALFQAFGYALL